MRYEPIISALFLAALAVSASAQPATPTTAPAAVVAANAATPAGWLGLTIGPVPEALAAHLNLADKVPPQGVMVLNLIKGGPADVAGLDRYDVILEVDGRVAPGTVARFVAGLRGRQPGEQLALSIIRHGQPQTISVRLAAAPSPEELEAVGAPAAPGMPGAPGAPAASATNAKWQNKYPAEPAVGLDAVNVGGGVLRRGDKGWEWQRLDPAAMPGLPAEVRQELTNRLRLDPQRDVSFRINQNRDGQSILIEQERGGQIVVRRGQGLREVAIATTAPAPGAVQVAVVGGAMEARTFASADELRQADPEAFELYQQVRSSQQRLLPVPGGMGGVMMLGTTTAPAGDAIATYEFRADSAALTGTTRPAGASARIEVKVTKAGNSLTLTFGSEDELKRLAPRIHEQYLKMKKSVE